MLYNNEAAFQVKWESSNLLLHPASSRCACRLPHWTPGPWRGWLVAACMVDQDSRKRLQKVGEGKMLLFVKRNNQHSFAHRAEMLFVRLVQHNWELSKVAGRLVVSGGGSNRVNTSDVVNITHLHKECRRLGKTELFWNALDLRQFDNWQGKIGEDTSAVAALLFSRLLAVKYTPLRFDFILYSKSHSSFWLNRQNTEPCVPFWL